MAAVDSTPDRIRIHYRRLPDREEIFDQRLLERRPDCVVTFLESTAAREPLVMNLAQLFERIWAKYWLLVGQ